ncbi:MAG: DciA family protein [Gammaproteobacteria bacterium]
MKRPRPLDDVMSSSATLHQLLARARQLQTLEQLLGARFGDAFTKHCKVAGVREDGTLVLVAQTPVWVTRLRYMAPDVISWARDTPELAGVRRVDVHVARRLAP